MVGVVGPTEPAERLAGAIGGRAVATDEADAVLAESPPVVAAIGRRAVSALVDADVAVPVLPVDVDEGFESVSVDRAPEVVAAGLEEGFSTRSLPVIEASVEGERLGRGALDAMLVTAEPARISEFSVETAGGDDRFRADGVVVATPAGSAGYTRALGGPVLDPAAWSLAVVPVAAFAVRPTVRVASADTGVAVTVVRDEGDIGLLVDGVDRGLVPPRRRVAVEVAGEVEVVRP